MSSVALGTEGGTQDIINAIGNKYLNICFKSYYYCYYYCCFFA